MSDIKTRLLKAIESLDLTFPQLERRTGIKAMKWRNLKNTATRVNEDHLEGLKKICPQYIYWVMTGEELPESGQIRPAQDKDEEQERNKDNNLLTPEIKLAIKHVARKILEETETETETETEKEKEKTKTKAD
ncbi:hypothetical protein [Methylomonas rivi]|uniref:DNA-binding protein n=1 Tax=Methylomonas rivi TaxID=2952226 RepID=A0ABT1U3A4_9GAMM|nr:hypothetical protein [Methylomonas sp. WSC-6]MCQ8128311.1 hypothetical protein [Methylomonas sp. WSC-6]